jgi:hypothetical protein
MAVTALSGLGEITTNFYLDDYAIYIQATSATGGYVSTDWQLLGFTSAEKSINFLDEKYEREDKIPRVVTYSKTIRRGIEITAGLSNLNEDLMAIFLQGTKSSVTGTNTGTRIGVGTTESSLEYRAIRFSGTRDDNKTFAITIPKCRVTYSGELTVGGESETVQELLFKGFFNPSADATANLYYINYWNNGVSVTAETPPAYT